MKEKGSSTFNTITTYNLFLKKMLLLGIVSFKTVGLLITGSYTVSKSTVLTPAYISLVGFFF